MNDDRVSMTSTFSWFLVWGKPHMYIPSHSFAHFFLLSTFDDSFATVLTPNGFTVPSQQTKCAALNA